ncbi:adenosylcobinamide-GDP ribazoletransferase [Candidatus Woesearchaeota archaeon]|nr:adenosylcobinamide-GDP ribazoletransferase [Candidatus Woesearchaeota archaeon]
MLSLIGFFTRLPVKKTSVEKASKLSYLLPLIGLMIGALAGFFYLVIDSLFIHINDYIKVLLTIVFLYLITGLNHLDGVADFFDGIYCCSSREKKVKALKDTRIGIAGVVSVLFLLMFLLFSLAKSEGVFLNIITAELAAKTSMLMAMLAGKPAEDGFGRFFIKNLKKGLLPLSISFSFIASYMLSGSRGVYALIISIIVMIVIVNMAHKHFGSTNGDVFGAVNEITRVCCLVFLLL